MIDARLAGIVLDALRSRVVHNLYAEGFLLGVHLHVQEGVLVAHQQGRVQLVEAFQASTLMTIIVQPPESGRIDPILKVIASLDLGGIDNPAEEVGVAKHGDYMRMPDPPVQPKLV